MNAVQRRRQGIVFPVSTPWRTKTSFWPLSGNLRRYFSHHVPPCCLRVHLREGDVKNSIASQAWFKRPFIKELILAFKYNLSVFVATLRYSSFLHFIEPNDEYIISFFLAQRLFIITIMLYSSVRRFCFSLIFVCVSL